MTLTYIFHSGFALEAERCILIFDFWMDPARVIPSLLTKGKPLYVLASHFHEDHFNKLIFKWKEHTKDIRFILSKDILKRRHATAEQADAWLTKGQAWQDENVKISATGSNDSGVSWVVEVEGRTIFHAGDLNNWYARFLANQDAIPETIMTEESGLINPRREEKLYLGELKDIAKIATHFDLAMFPVDSRIGNGYTLGGRQFLARFPVRLFAPMHFVSGGFESAWRIEDYCAENGVDFWRISHNGESIPVR